MSSRRDSLFPATSIGRSPVANIARTESRESLTAHPLLAPASDSTTPPSNKYVPYTPRQRPATTGSPVLPTVSALPQQPQPCATGKLQLMNLKAAAQDMGLDAGSVGWAILEKLSYEGDTSEEWAEIWNAVTKDKASLLLPLEQLTAQEKITPEFVQDHTIVFNTASRDDTPVVALSGLRGDLVNDILTLRSTISPTTKQFRELFTSPSSRISLLNALPPLPYYPPESPYPKYNVLAYADSLPMPSKPSKPPLPPRPNTRVAPIQPPSRLSMPFASLFGQKQSLPTPLSSSSQLPSPAPGTLPPRSTSPSSPSTTTTITGSGTDIDPPITISAFTIPTSLSLQHISTSIVSALTSDLASSLTAQPPWLVERVQTFASAFFPFVRASVGGKKKKKKLQDLVGNAGGGGYVVNDVMGGAEELSQRMQEFYGVIEAEMRRDARPVESGEHGDGNERQAGVDEREAQEEEETRIRDVLETVEATLCSLLYDRLFVPAGSDDASHDAALSSRIAALNMLDLTLAHLDLEVDVGTSEANQTGHAAPGTSLNAVIRDCGQTLAQLDLASRTPRDKARVIVSAHKIVVEGLAKVPPVRLRNRDVHTPLATPAPAVSSMNPDSDSLQIVVSSPESVGEQREILESALFRRSPSPELPTHPPEPTTTTPTMPTSSETPTMTPVSGDILLPILIFSVVKANPANLVSHLLFTQRFRNHSVGGEEGYCLVNLMAVAEFLENVDLGVLGLEGGDRVSTAELTPIPVVSAAASAASTPAHPSQEATGIPDGIPPSLRGRVEQGVDVIAGSANRVISGVFDTSFGVLRALMPGQNLAGGAAAVGGAATATAGEGPTSIGAAISGGETSPSLAPSAATTGTSSGAGAGAWDTGVRLLRRESAFSIASLAASLPGTVVQGARSRAASRTEEVGQQELVEVVPRPASVKSGGGDMPADRGDDKEHHQGDDESEEEEEEEEEEDSESESGEEEEEEVHDTRSIKSFESMMRRSRKKRRRPSSFSSVASVAAAGGNAARKSLADRLNNVRGLSRLSHHEGNSTKVTSMRSTTYPFRSGSVSGTGSAQGQPFSIQLPPPNRRFLECAEDDLKISEVRELLMEYRRLVEAVQSMSGFEE
ncbi:hypothetical protein V8B97DRAFT_2078625 [Scleroderma yunnanense]